ncbi:hypothetical protein M1247_34250 [Mycobacterium sp. 21AC1]|uniref:hypothetical protein n=1 Tax=[Mycobacterium] appelbergii TaxID=2939269 RepID=UPI00293911C0|nr:hypothetical protein [Mycobacterium sp. 21AC1]MDV3130008.1 hypothetical protein [Mycobacterium sp. 21AC1]
MLTGLSPRAAAVLIIAVAVGIASGLLVAGIQTGSTVLVVSAAVIYVLAACALVAAMRKLRRP